MHATFITLNEAQPEASAVAIKQERIVAVGNEETLLEACKGHDTTLIDLKGATVTPGFIDTYSHFILYGWLANHSLDLSTTNAFQRTHWKPAKTIDDFLIAIKANLDPKKTWLIISGYDEGRVQGAVLDQAKLDEIDTIQPIIVFHASGQKVLLNSSAIRKIQQDKMLRSIYIDYEGIISGDNLNQFLKAFIKPEEVIEAIETAAKHYAKQGYTTITEVNDLASWVTQYNALTQSHDFPLDVIYSTSNAKRRQQLDQVSQQNPRMYPGPVVIKVDGLAQNYAAYLTTPYIQTTSPFGSDWRGALKSSPNELEHEITSLLKQKIPLAIEAHGDAAIDFSLNLLQKVEKEGPSPILINIEYIREDQLQRLKLLGIQASWFSPYLFYWGENMCHARLGPERALQMNPLHSAKKILGLTTAHANSPAVPPSPIDAMNWMTTRIVQRWNYPVNRRCPQYFNIDERVSMQEALESFTLDAAKLYQLDHEKGSIEPGKLADMTILSHNPLKNLNDPLTVKGTIARGIIHLQEEKESRVLPRL
ncbi:amidohydrolase [Legionella impletisoli]|uniref:Amidohydrolase n=2 Tax=Legionella impletisoli TaxID=343510 RepID=A0A917JYH0_9GAMM|nr:amidohydrolase [Legionella impletisoli]